MKTILKAASVFLLAVSVLFPMNFSFSKTALIEFEKRTTHTVDLFEQAEDYFDTGLSKAVDQYQILRIDANELNDINKSKPANITFLIPVSKNKKLECVLSISELLSDDFKTGTNSRSGTYYFDYKKGLYYSGVIKDVQGSIVNINIFDSHIIGIISDGTGNYNLTPLNSGKNNEYIYFNDRNLKENSDFSCGVDDNNGMFNRNATKRNNLHGNLVREFRGGNARIYFECDYKMYLDFGSSVDSVLNYVTAFFNSVKTLYQNENIPVVISEVNIWTTQDPYLAYPNTLSILKRFSHEKQNNFNGDLAHLISTRLPNIGGIAWLNVLCYPYLASDSAGPAGFSSIFTTFEPFPVFSYTVQVVTHELGHNFGSRHTHACVWPLPQGGFGALDSCYTVEGNCYAGPVIGRAGTIMSYCLFAQGGSIDFTLGFGPRPGDTIRAGYSLAPCIIGIQSISDEIPEQFELLQNYPNPFNPTTTISFNLPESGIVKLEVYDINGKLSEMLFEGELHAGKYETSWNAELFASGIYFYRITTKEFSLTKKMVLIK
ncbi:MAG: T9SS type A sorting domain-containing protein [Ignavibacteria bacterium]|nr:T9SS type A sorting domain-containing protein [Ignavibacteria bacterium]